LVSSLPTVSTDRKAKFSDRPMWKLAKLPDQHHFPKFHAEITNKKWVFHAFSVFQPKIIEFEPKFFMFQPTFKSRDGSKVQQMAQRWVLPWENVVVLDPAT